MKKIFRFRGQRGMVPPGPSENSGSSGAGLMPEAGARVTVVLRHHILRKNLGQLHRAARKGDVPKVQRQLLLHPTLLNARDKKKRTALHLACVKGHLGVVTLLTDRKCDMNLCDNENRTALMTAVQCRKDDCAALLLERGADPDIKDRDGNTALHYTVLERNILMSEKLLLHNADIEAKGEDENTPLLIAVRLNNLKMVEFLLSQNANINAVDKKKRTVLMHAVVDDETSNIVRLLLQQGVDVSSQDAFGRTAEEYAFDRGHKVNGNLISEYKQKMKCKESSENHNLDTELQKSPKQVSREENSKKVRKCSQRDPVIRLLKNPATADSSSTSDEDINVESKTVVKPKLAKQMTAWQQSQTNKAKYAIVRPEIQLSSEESTSHGEHGELVGRLPKPSVTVQASSHPVLPSSEPLREPSPVSLAIGGLTKEKVTKPEFEKKENVEVSALGLREEEYVESPLDSERFSASRSQKHADHFSGATDLRGKTISNARAEELPLGMTSEEEQERLDGSGNNHAYVEQEENDTPKTFSRGQNDKISLDAILANDRGKPKEKEDHKKMKSEIELTKPANGKKKKVKVSALGFRGKKYVESLWDSKRFCASRSQKHADHFSGATDLRGKSISNGQAEELPLGMTSEEEQERLDGSGNNHAYVEQEENDTPKTLFRGYNDKIFLDAILTNDLGKPNEKEEHKKMKSEIELTKPANGKKKKVKVSALGSREEKYVESRWDSERYSARSSKKHSDHFSGATDQGGKILSNGQAEECMKSTHLVSKPIRPTGAVKDPDPSTAVPVKELPLGMTSEEEQERRDGSGNNHACVEQEQNDTPRTLSQGQNHEIVLTIGLCKPKETEGDRKKMNSEMFLQSPLDERNVRQMHHPKEKVVYVYPSDTNTRNLESLEKRISHLEMQNKWLQQQLNYVRNQEARAVFHGQDQIQDIIKIFQGVSAKRSHATEEKTKKLINELNFRAEMTEVKRQLRQELADTMKQQSLSQASLELILRSCRNLEAAKTDMRKTLEQLIRKMEDHTATMQVRYSERSHLAKTIDCLEKKLLSMRQIEEKREKLENTGENLIQGLSNRKDPMTMNTVENSEAEHTKREVGEQARQNIEEKWKGVNPFLKERAASGAYLVGLTENKNTSMKSQTEVRSQDLKAEPLKEKIPQWSVEMEVEKYKQLYFQELRARTSLEKKLNNLLRTNERQAEIKTPPVTEWRNTVPSTAVTRPVLEPPWAGSLNNSSRLSRSLAPREHEVIPTSILQCWTSDDSIESYLTKRFCASRSQKHADHFSGATDLRGKTKSNAQAEELPLGMTSEEEQERLDGSGNNHAYVEQEENDTPKTFSRGQNDKIFPDAILANDRGKPKEKEDHKKMKSEIELTKSANGKKKKVKVSALGFRGKKYVESLWDSKRFCASRSQKHADHFSGATDLRGKTKSNAQAEELPLGMTSEEEQERLDGSGNNHAYVEQEENDTPKTFSRGQNDKIFPDAILANDRGKPKEKEDHKKMKSEIELTKPAIGKRHSARSSKKHADHFPGATDQRGKLLSNGQAEECMKSTHLVSKPIRPTGAVKDPDPSTAVPVKELPLGMTSEEEQERLDGSGNNHACVEQEQNDTRKTLSRGQNHEIVLTIGLCKPKETEGDHKKMNSEMFLQSPLDERNVRQMHHPKEKIVYVYQSDTNTRNLESLEKRISHLELQNKWLQQQLNYVRNQEARAVFHGQGQIQDIIKIFQGVSAKRSHATEEKTKKLINELNFRAEMTEVKRQLRQELADTMKQQSLSQASLELILRSCRNLEAAKTDMRKTLEQLIRKMEDHTAKMQVRYLERSHLAKIIDCLEKELLSMREIEEKREKLENTGENLIQGLSNCKGPMTMNMVENSEAEHTKREVEEQARQNIEEKWKEVNPFLKERAASGAYLVGLTENKNTSVKSQMEVRSQDLKAEPLKEKIPQWSIEMEVEKYKQLYFQELRARTSLEKKLNNLLRTNERQAEIRTPPVTEWRNTVPSTAVTRPVLEPPWAGSLNNSSRLSRSLAPREHEVFPTSTPQCWTSDDSIETYLTKVQHKLHKRLRRELRKDAAEV